MASSDKNISKEEIYDDYVKSGLSISEFCRRTNLKKSTFYGWIKKYSNKDKTYSESLNFAKVEVKNESTYKFKVNGTILEFYDSLAFDKAIKFVIQNAG